MDLEFEIYLIELFLCFLILQIYISAVWFCFLSFAFFLFIFNIALHLILKINFMFSLTSISKSTCRKCLWGSVNFSNGFFICILSSIYFCWYVFANALFIFLYYIWATLSKPFIFCAIVWVNSTCFSITLDSGRREEFSCGCVVLVGGSALYFPEFCKCFLC